MPHRHADIVSFCSICDKTATEKCMRCEVTFCTGHQPPADTRCMRCEEQYAIVLEKKGLMVPKERLLPEQSRRFILQLLAISPIALFGCIVAFIFKLNMAALFLGAFGIVLMPLGAVYWFKFIFQQHVEVPYLEPMIAAKKIKEERKKFLLESPSVTLLE